MVDLYLGCVGIIALAIMVFVLTHYATRSLSKWQSNLLALATVAVIGFYIHELWYDARLARWLPFSNLIVIGNWLPLLAAVLAALVVDHLQASILRRCVFVGALSMVGVWTLVHPLLGDAPRCRNEWDSSGYCRQTTNFTCSPAAAATLLRLHGIASTEQEMAERCLTLQGTSWPGLYRGLKQKTSGTTWDVEVVDCTAEDLPRFDGSPMIISVGLDRNARVDANFSQEYGWVPGVNHSVVLLGISGDQIEIADPSQPLATETWDRHTLKLLWRGLAIRLTERK